jgi:hypothetical protein
MSHTCYELNLISFVFQLLSRLATMCETHFAVEMWKVGA